MRGVENRSPVMSLSASEESVVRCVMTAKASVPIHRPSTTGMRRRWVIPARSFVSAARCDSAFPSSPAGVVTIEISTAAWSSRRLTPASFRMAVKVRASPAALTSPTIS